LTQIESIVSEIEREKEAGKFMHLDRYWQQDTSFLSEAERKRSRLAATAAGQAAMASRVSGAEA
jgi:20S proteasome subunit alpha 4